MSKKWPLALLLFLLPLILSLLWGRHLSSGGSLLALQALDPRQYAAFPGYTAVLSSLLRLGLDPLWAALLLSAAGWGLAALGLAAVGSAVGLPRGGLAAGWLLAFNPYLFRAAGEPWGWVVGLLAIGAAAAWRQRWLMALAAMVPLAALFLDWPLTLLWPDGLGPPLLYSLLLWILCCGADWLGARLARDDLQRTSLALLAAVGLLIGGWQLLQATERWSTRPVAALQAQAEVARWLQRETDPRSSLLAPPTVALLAGRTAQPWPNPLPLDLAAYLVEQPPELIVAGDSLSWDLVRESLWFRLNYAPLHAFAPTDMAEAVTVYQRQAPRADLGPRMLLNARVPDRLTLLGVQLGPELVEPGATTELLLSLQAARASLLPPGPFEAVVRLVSPLTGDVLAEWSTVLPQDNRAAAWQPEQVIEESLVLTLPDGLPGGGYLLNLSLREEGADEWWPFSFNNDVNRLDRVPLTTLAVPQANRSDPAKTLDAQFDGRIALSGVTIGAAADESLPVTLFWEPLAPIDEDYVVFVHLLDKAGQLATGHDGRPDDGRFPTASWRPGLVIADTHPLALPVDLPPGTYTIQAGLYDPQTGVRLPLTNNDEEEDTVRLGQVTLD